MVKHRCATCFVGEATKKCRLALAETARRLAELDEEKLKAIDAAITKTKPATQENLA